MSTDKPKRPANRNEMQAFYTLEIEKLLEQRGKMPFGAIATAMGLEKGTLATYLRIMRRAGVVRRNGYQDGKPQWELGEETVAPKQSGPVEDLHAQQGSVPARQVGMFRHWMDVALFGAPGQGAAAC